MRRDRSNSPSAKVFEESKSIKTDGAKNNDNFENQKLQVDTEKPSLEL